MIAQRGHDDLHHREPVEQVHAETRAPGFGGEVAVGTGDHAHVHALHPAGADLLDFAFLQDAQQLRLDSRRKLADLVEHDGPAVCE